MNKPKIPILPAKPTKPRSRPKKLIIKTQYINHNLDFYDGAKNIGSLIKILQTLSFGKDPEKIFIETNYSDYDNNICDINFYEKIEIDNPNYDKQLASYHKSVASYENKLKNYEIQMKKYSSEMKQYNLNMKAYYELIVQKQ